jgi:hypothetical protein
MRFPASYLRQAEFVASQPASQAVTQLRDQPVATVYIRVVTGQSGYLLMQIGQNSELCIVVVREVSVFGLG